MSKSLWKKCMLLQEMQPRSLLLRHWEWKCHPALVFQWLMTFWIQAVFPWRLNYLLPPTVSFATCSIDKNGLDLAQIWSCQFRNNRIVDTALSNLFLSISVTIIQWDNAGVEGLLMFICELELVSFCLMKDMSHERQLGHLLAEAITASSKENRELSGLKFVIVWSLLNNNKSMSGHKFMQTVNTLPVSLSAKALNK